MQTCRVRQPIGGHIYTCTQRNCRDNNQGRRSITPMISTYASLCFVSSVVDHLSGLLLCLLKSGLETRQDRIISRSYAHSK